MAELLETERSYVKDLESAINCFLRPLQSMKEVPLPLKGKEDIIFGNLEEILVFHKSIFLKALEKYESMPEDVGHCFVTWVSALVFVWERPFLTKGTLFQSSHVSA